MPSRADLLLLVVIVATLIVVQAYQAAAYIALVAAFLYWKNRR